MEVEYFNLQRDKMRRIILRYAEYNVNKQAKGFMLYNGQFHKQNAFDCWVIFRRKNRLAQKLMSILESKGKIRNTIKVQNLMARKRRLGLTSKLPLTQDPSPTHVSS